MTKYIIAQTVTTTYHIPEAIDEKDAHDILENDDDGKLIESIIIEYTPSTESGQKKRSCWSKDKGWHSD